MSQSFPTALIKRYSSYRWINFPDVYRLLSRRAILTVLAISLISIGVLGKTILSRLEGRIAGDIRPGSSVPVAGIQSQKLDAIRFVITQRGIEPAELTIAPGRYWVAVDNDLSFDGVVLNVDRANGPRVLTARSPLNHRKFKDFIEFGPGDYIISPADNPKMQARISVITGKQ